MAKSKRPPRNGTELRKQLLAQFEIDSADQLAILDVACAALDQAVAAEATLKAEGLVVPGARGPRPHPCANIARDARMRLLAALKQLGLAGE
jgi:phage terminase small subunit